MKRKLISACTVLILSATLVACARSPQARRDKYVAAGKQYLQKHDYARAIIQFKNAAQEMPKDPQIYYQMGLAFAGAQDYTAAAASFQRTLTLKPDDTAAQFAIADIFAHTSNPQLLEDARKRLNALVETSSPTAQMLNTLALTELELGNRQSGVERLEQALLQMPGDLRSSLMLARAKLEAGDAKSAEEVLKKAVSAAPQSAEVRRFLAGFYAAQRRLPEAETEFRQAVALDGKNGMALMELANVELALGRKDEAEQAYRKAATLDGFQYAYGAFLFQEGRHGEAIREFERLAQAAPDDRIGRTRLVVAYRAANRLADAESVLDKALKKNPKDFDALLQKSEMLIAAQKYAQAEIYLNQVIHSAQSAPEAHYVMAKLHQARGEDLMYRSELAEALRLNPYLLAVRLELAQSLTSSKAPAAALDLLNAAPASQKDLVAVVVQRNWAYWSAGNLPEMRKGIAQGLAKGDSPDLLLQDGMLKLKTGDPAGAQRAFEQALKIDPQNLRAAAALSQTYTARKQPAMAVQKMREYAAAQPKSAPAQELLGMVLFASGDHAQARTAFQAATAIDPTFVRADLDLVRLDAIEGKWGDAAEKLKKVIAANPGNSTAMHWLGDVQVDKGDLSAALDQYRRVVDTNPNNALALNNLAFLLAAYRKQPDEALKYAEKAAELDPDNPDFADTLGWVLYQKGLYDVAIPHLKRAAASPQNVAWKYHLAMAYAKAGQKENAEDILSAALKSNSKAPEAQAALAVVREGK